MWVTTLGFISNGVFTNEFRALKFKMSLKFKMFQTDWRTASQKPSTSSSQITLTNEKVTPTSSVWLFWWKAGWYEILLYTCNLQDGIVQSARLHEPIWWRQSSCARRGLIRQLHWKTRLFMRSVWIAAVLSRQLLPAHKSSRLDWTMRHLNWQGSMGGNIITCRLHNTNHTMFAFLKGGRALHRHDHFRDLHV